MKTDTQLKTARIGTFDATAGIPIIFVSAYGDRGQLIANLLEIYSDGSIKSVPNAKQFIEDNGYALPGAKWGAKGEILTQDD